MNPFSSENGLFLYPQAHRISLYNHANWCIVDVGLGSEMGFRFEEPGFSKTMTIELKNNSNNLDNRIEKTGLSTKNQVYRGFQKL